MVCCLSQKHRLSMSISKVGPCQSKASPNVLELWQLILIPPAPSRSSPNQPYRMPLVFGLQVFPKLPKKNPHDLHLQKTKTKKTPTATRQGDGEIDFVCILSWQGRPTVQHESNDRFTSGWRCKKLDGATNICGPTRRITSGRVLGVIGVVTDLLYSSTSFQQQAAR